MTNPLPTLTSHLAAGRLALFVGADLPEALTGLPARADLARGLAERHGLDPTLRLAAAAQRVMQGGNRFAFTDYLGRRLDPLGRHPQRFHQLLAQLPTRAIVTTAYDSMLELAFQQAGEPIDVLVRDSDVAFADPQRRTLIKLYGDVRQRDTLIVTEDDHYGLWRSRDRESLLNEVRSILSRHALLFLGYDLADPDFNLLWRELLDRMGRFAMGAYAVWPGAPDDERRVWEGRQVRVIDEQPLELLERLVAAASGGPASQPETNAQASGAVIAKKEPDQMSQLNRAALRQLLTQYFNDGELRNLCFDLGIDYESLPGGGKADKARELIAYCERHQRMADLIALCAQLQPKVPWQDAAPGFAPAGAQGTGVAATSTSAKADAQVVQQASEPPAVRPAKRATRAAGRQALQPQETAGYDAFISYSSKDSDWVRGTLLPRLERAGLRVCIDKRDFAIGVPILDNIEQAVERSHKTLLVLTPNWVASEWTAFDLLLLQTSNPAGRGQRILPLLVHPCELPARLRIFTYLDLTDPAESDSQLDRLVRTIRPSADPPTAPSATLQQAAAQTAPAPAQPTQPAAGGFSYERGLAALQQRLESADVEVRLAFAVLETRLRENLRDDRLYGSTETTRSERARITHELNRLALNHAGPTFNQLCGG